MINIIIIRHAESVANKKSETNPETWFEHSEGLTPEAKVQITHIVKHLSKENISQIISSTEERAVRTAETINQTLRKKIKQEKNLSELKLSSKPLTSNQLDKLKEKWKNKEDFTFQGGESLHKFQERCVNALNSIENNTLVVTHQGVIRAIIAELTNNSIFKSLIDVDYCKGIKISFNEEIIQNLIGFPDKKLLKNILKHRKTVVGILKDEDGSYLVVNKKTHDQDTWTFPQGGFEKEESAEQALRRELSEELSISTTDNIKPIDIKRKILWPPGYEGHHGSKGVEFCFLKADIKSSEIEINDGEIKNFKLVDNVNKYIDFDFEYGYGQDLKKLLLHVINKSCIFCSYIISHVFPER